MCSKLLLRKQDTYQMKWLQNLHRFSTSVETKTEKCLSVRPSVCNLWVRWVSIIGLSWYYTGYFMGWFCMSGWKIFLDIPIWPPLGPIFLYFWGILAHTLGFATGVILIVYVLVYVFLRSFKHSPGGIFSLFQNIQFWALWRGFKNRGLKPLNMHFFNRVMLYRHIIYHLKGIVNKNKK